MTPARTWPAPPRTVTPRRSALDALLCRATLGLIAAQNRLVARALWGGR